MSVNSELILNRTGAPEYTITFIGALQNVSVWKPVTLSAERICDAYLSQRLTVDRVLEFSSFYFFLMFQVNFLSVGTRHYSAQ
jgi:hypothetical protein